jgi:hypothetical protein
VKLPHSTLDELPNSDSQTEGRLTTKGDLRSPRAREWQFDDAIEGYRATRRSVYTEWVCSVKLRIQSLAAR